MALDREEARAEAKSRLTEYIGSLDLKAGVCPLCDGGHNTGCFSVDPKTDYTRWKCFKCDKSGDIFDLYAELNNLERGSRAALEGVYETLGIDYQKGGKVKQTRAAAKTAKAESVAEAPSQAEECYVRVFRRDILGSIVDVDPMYRDSAMSLLSDLDIKADKIRVEPLASALRERDRLLATMSEEEAIKKAKEWHSQKLDELRYGHTHTHTHTHIKQPKLTEEEKAAAAKDFKAYLLKASAQLDDPAAVAYLEKRGLSLDLARQFGLGYDGQWLHPKAQKVRSAIPSPRLIIPTGSLSYTARDIRAPEEIPEAERESKYYAPKKKAKAYDDAESEPFNGGVLSQSGVDGFNTEPLYIVEGELDAMSIMEAGGNAIGLSSTSGVMNFLRMAKELDQQFNEPDREWLGANDLGLKMWEPHLVLALDNDKAGQEATKTLSEGLSALGVDFIIENAETLYGGSKDANAALVADRDGFSSRLLTSYEAYAKRKEALRDSVAEEYRKTRSAAAAIPDFLAAVKAPRDTILSGFKRLDMLLSGDELTGDRGGLSEGLYCVGAVSSLGKTTFLLQMADTIAEAGKDVIIFSLEMSRNDLISKSLSRLTLRLATELFKLGGQEANKIAKTNYGISKGARYEKYSPEEKGLISAAVDYYEKRIAPRVFIYEGAIGGTRVDEIKRAVAEHTEKTGKAPVVIVDYLQMLSAESDRLTDKQAVDRNVLALKVISRDYHTPVMCVSSYNRDSYTAEGDLSNFKESGAIEYSADVVISLSYADVETAEKGSKDAGKAKKALKAQGKLDERNIILEVLKNRNGRKGDIRYSFKALFNTFRELPAGDERAAKMFG